MGDFFLAIRIKDWWNAILIPIISFYLLGNMYVGHGCNSSSSLEIFQLLLLSISIASFGFFLNELTDVQEDMKAGKRNIVSKFSFLKSFGIMAFLLLTIFFSSIPFWYNFKITGLILLQLVLLTVYSCPPIRLKRNPYIAVILDSIYSGTLFFFIALLISDVHLTPRIIILTLLFGFCKGLRNIIYHIQKDAKIDFNAGQETLAHISKQSHLNTLQILLFWVEIISLSILTFPINKITFTFLIIGLSLVIAKYNYYRKYSKNKITDSKIWLSEVNTVYEVWFFLGVITSWTLTSRWQITLLLYIFTFAFFPKSFRIFNEVYVLLVNIYFLGYKMFYFVNDLYFIHTKPHFDIGKHWRKLKGKDAVE